MRGGLIIITCSSVKLIGSRGCQLRDALLQPRALTPVEAEIANGRPGSTIPATTTRSARVLLSRKWLTRFGFGAFLQRGFARKFYPAFVVDSDALDPNDVADLGNVFRSLHTKIRELGNVHEPILAGENFDKRAEFLRRDNATLIRLADLDLARHAADNFFRARHAFTAGRIDVHRAVVLDVNFSAGLRDDALDGPPAGSDKRSDLLRIDFDGFDSWR